MDVLIAVKLTSWVLSVLLCSALVRPGRFDMQVTVPRPDVKGRTEILNWYLKKIKVDEGMQFSYALCYLFILLFNVVNADIDLNRQITEIPDKFRRFNS